MGIGKGKRNETTAGDAEAAMADLDEIGDTIRNQSDSPKRRKTQT